MKKVIESIKHFFKNLKDSIVLMDKKKLLVLLILIIVIILFLIILLIKPKSLECKQTVDIEGITNLNTIEITYKGDQIKEVKTTFNYEIGKDGNSSGFKQIKDAMDNLGNVYKEIDGVEFKTTKNKDSKYQAVQTINFDEISNSDLANVGIERSYKKAKENYEAAGYTCK